MNTAEFKGVKVNYNKTMNIFLNDDTRKMIFISKGLDEIHAVLEVNENQEIKVVPSWNVNFSIINEKEITIDVNHNDYE